MSGFIAKTLNRQSEAAGSIKPQLEKPRKYKVLLANDDFTPMDFVVTILKRFFSFDEALAVKIMLQIHYHGQGLCGIFTREIAETKVTLVNEYAREHEHPLLCIMEPE